MNLNFVVQEISRNQKIFLSRFREFHLMKMSSLIRGLEFREAYRNVSDVVSVIQCPTLCVSATLNSDIVEDLQELLALPMSTYKYYVAPDR